MGANVFKSKKQSVASLSLQPESFIFFIDRSLGRKIIPNALREVGEKVMVHDEHFSQNTTDEEWLEKVGRQGWIVFTKDSRIRYHKNEIRALWRAKVKAFVLTARGDLQAKEMASIFIKALPKIKNLTIDTKPPFVAHVSRDGTVSLVKSSA